MKMWAASLHHAGVVGSSVAELMFGRSPDETS
jgi:hypothetical protein